jgi:CRP/FNR family cyclic AMP-dependent transcriptional regulator
MSIFDGIPFFKDIDKSVAHKNETFCQRKTFSEKELILDYQDATLDIYFIVSGLVRILNRTPSGKEMIFGDYGPETFFGEMAAIDNSPRSANVTAVTNTIALIIPGKIFNQIIASDGTLNLRLMTAFTARIRDLNTRLFERSILDIRHRLYSELLRLSKPKKQSDTTLAISPPPYQHDLAARIGCRREQVNREITTMIEDGFLEKRKGALVILKPEVLRKRILDEMNEG